MVRILLLACFSFVLSPALALDVVNFEKGISDRDLRKRFKQQVLEQALEHTREEYGDYQINVSSSQLTVKRAMIELEKGTLINSYVAVTTEEWEKRTIPIRIPLRRGLLNYRLLVINKEDAPLFEEVHTVEDLKKLKAGLVRGWATTSIFQNEGFKVEIVNDFDGMFRMLAQNRFHFTVRGVNEVFDELEQRKPKLDKLMPAPNIALYIPSPTYLFVSPKYPRLAERLKKGLELMIEDGTLEDIFDQYFLDDIKKAELSTRRLVPINNPFLPAATPLDNPKLWYQSKPSD